MKCIVMASLFIFSLPALAQHNERQLIKCLGEEEKAFHKNKELGPIYELNQRLIAEMIQIPHAELDDLAYTEMCKTKNASASLKLLELSIRRGSEIFDMPKSVSGIQRSVAEGMIVDYVEATKDIFLGLMTSIQTLAPSASCIKEEIPEVDSFFSDIKYLQEDVDMKKIFAGRDAKIFRKLLGYKAAFKRCQARIKKKLKSESKAAPKKS